MSTFLHLLPIAFEHRFCYMLCSAFLRLSSRYLALRWDVLGYSGTITCMEFYKSTHLLTGSEDHTVCIWRVHDWALLHVLGGHKAAVTSLRYVGFLPPGTYMHKIHMHNPVEYRIQDGRTAVAWLVQLLTARIDTHPQHEEHTCRPHSHRCRHPHVFLDAPRHHCTLQRMQRMNAVSASTRRAEWPCPCHETGLFGCGTCSRAAAPTSSACRGRGSSYDGRPAGAGDGRFFPCTFATSRGGETPKAGCVLQGGLLR